MPRMKAADALKKLRGTGRQPEGGHGHGAARLPAEKGKDPFTTAVLTESGLLGSDFWKRATSVQSVILAASVGILLYLMLPLAPECVREPAQKTLTAMAVAGPFLLGYRQWHLGRHEISYDKYYDRLALANDYIDHFGREKGKAENGGILDHLWTMRAFTELDNLEYILGKYEQGFVGIYPVERAVHAFRSECNEPEFRKKVLHWIGPEAGREVAGG